MPARIPCSIGSIAFVSALSVSILGVTPLVGSAAAADCLVEPNSAAPENSHWYYRTDKTTQRKCWYLRAINDAPQQESLKTAQAAPAPNDHSFSNFKTFIAQRGDAKLSHADVEKLYAEFLEWRRNPGNEVKERQ